MAKLDTRALWQIPGLLSLSRVPLGALFVAVSSKPVPAIAVLFFAALTDVADGWYARKFHQETPTGRVLDPITDKLFVATVVVSLVASKTLAVSEALLLGMRELCQLPLLLVLISEGRHRQRAVRGANRLGKFATVMQFASVAAILLRSSHRQGWVLSTAACGLLAGVSYAWREWPSRKQAASERGR